MTAAGSGSMRTARPMSLPEHSWRRRFFLTAALRNRSGRKSLRAISGHREKSWHRRRACAGCFTGRIRKAGPALCMPGGRRLQLAAIQKRTFAAVVRCCVPSPCHFLQGVRRCPPACSRQVPRVRTGKWGISNRSVILFCCQSGANSLTGVR